MTSRRWEVLTGVAAAFARGGYQGVGMREIADGLGINPGTLYHHFRSKDDALLAVCEVGQRRTLDNLEAALDGAPQFETRVRTLIASHLVALGEIGDFLHAYVTLGDLVPDDLAGPLRLSLSAYWARMSQLFGDAVLHGEMDPALDRRNAGRMLTGIIRDLNVLDRGGRSEELSSFADTALAIFLGGCACAMPEY